MQEAKSAPEFQLKDQNGQNVELQSFRDRLKVVLFFYPKNFTPICTLEVIAFRNSYDEFNKLGAEVMGVSSDEESSHSKFCSSYELPFKLLSDPGQQVKKLYQPTGLIGRMANRMTFVIDEKGIILGEYLSSLRSQAHVDFALNLLRK